MWLLVSGVPLGRVLLGGHCKLTPQLTDEFAQHTHQTKLIAQHKKRSFSVDAHEDWPAGLAHTSLEEEKAHQALVEAGAAQPGPLPAHPILGVICLSDADMALWTGTLAALFERLAADGAAGGGSDSAGGSPAGSAGAAGEHSAAGSAAATPEHKADGGSNGRDGGSDSDRDEVGGLDLS